MFKFEVGNDDFEVFMEAASSFCREGILQFEQEKVRFVGVDSAGVVLTECEVPGKIVSGDPEHIGLDFKMLQQVAKKARGDTLHLEHDGGIVRIQAARTTYSLQTLVVPKCPNVPDIPSTVSIDINPDMLAEGILAVTDVADNKDISAGVWFVWNNGQFKLRDKQEMVVEVEYGAEEYKGVPKEGVTSVRVLISKMYAERIAMMLKKYDVCRVAIGTDIPLVVVMKSDNQKCGFVVAPRIEVD
mgnify:CR=1 FL=1